MEKYQVGEIITGTITGIEDYGIFLSFGNNSSGLIHISEISDKFIKDIHKYSRINDELSAQILSYEGNNHYKLSIKRMNHNDSDSKLETPSETELGFSTLSSKLPEWIENKMEEIEKK